MAEPNIHDTVSPSSPILAYGQSADQRRRFWFVPILLGIFLLLLSSAAVWLISQIPLPLPQRPLLLAFVPNNAHLPAGAPALWVDAQKNNSPFPIFVGLAHTQTGPAIPFVVTPHLSWTKTEQTSRLWQLHITKDASVPTDSAPPHGLVASWWDYASPWLRIWPPVSSVGSSTSSSIQFLPSIGGPIRNGRWETDIGLPALETAHAPSFPEEFIPSQGTNFVNLQRLPGIWPSIQSLFPNLPTYLKPETAPRAIEWQNSSDSVGLDIHLVFSNRLNPPDKAALAAAAGIYDRVSLKLPDGGLITELRTPIHAVSSSTSATWKLSDGRLLSIRDWDIHLGSASSTQEPVQLPENCAGSLVAIFNRTTLNRLTEVAFPPIPLFDRPLFWVERDHHLEACW